MKSFQKFKADTLGGSFGNPGTNTYIGECVSYVRLYMEEVLGVKTSIWGHAVDYWTNPAVLKLFERVQDGRDGDIMVWGDDPGNWTGKEGHIGIKDGRNILNQNFGGSRRVTVNPIFTQGFIGYLRLKEDEMVTFNEGDRVNKNLALYGEDRGRFKFAVGKEYKDADYAIMQSDEFKEDALINKGDLENIEAKLGVKVSDKFAGRPSKSLLYGLTPPNAQQAQYVEVTEKLYRKK